MPTIHPSPGPSRLRPGTAGLFVLLVALGTAGCRSRSIRAPEGVARHATALEAPTLPSTTRGPTGRTDLAQAGDAHVDVRALVAADFGVRARAAQRLVRAGAASLPALGAAGPQPLAAPGGAAQSTTAPVIEAILAALPDDEALAWLASPHAALRSAAALAAGRRRDHDAVPGLIEALADPSPDVRSAARLALQRVTGETGDPRVAGVPASDLRQRWRTWWRQTGQARRPASKRGA